MLSRGPSAFDTFAKDVPKAHVTVTMTNASAAVWPIRFEDADEVMQSCVDIAAGESGVGGERAPCGSHHPADVPVGLCPSRDPRYERHLQKRDSAIDSNVPPMMMMTHTAHQMHRTGGECFFRWTSPGFASGLPPEQKVISASFSKMAFVLSLCLEPGSRLPVCMIHHEREE